HLEKAVTEKNLRPVSQPQVEKIDFSETGPLKFRATFEVLPDFQLGEYKNLEVEVEPQDLSGADVDKAISRSSHSGGVRSVQRRRPATTSSRSYPMRRRNASLASRIRPSTSQTKIPMILASTRRRIFASRSSISLC